MCVCVCVCVCVRMCVHVYEEKGTQCDYINCLNLVRRWSFPNFLQSTITIEEPPPPPTTAPPTDTPLLIHAIIWPIVGGVILVILLAVALYCVSTLGRRGGGGMTAWPSKSLRFKSHQFTAGERFLFVFHSAPYP